MTPRQIPHLMRIPHRNTEARPGRLLHTQARLRPAPEPRRHSGLHRRRPSPPSLMIPPVIAPLIIIILIIIVINAMRIGRGALLPGGGGGRAGGHGRAQGEGFFLRRDGRAGCSSSSWGGGIVGCGGRRGGAERAEGVVFDSLEAGGLGDEAARDQAGGAGGCGCGCCGCGGGGGRCGRGGGAVVVGWLGSGRVGPGIFHCDRLWGLGRWLVVQLGRQLGMRFRQNLGSAQQPDFDGGRFMFMLMRDAVVVVGDGGKLPALRTMTDVKLAFLGSDQCGVLRPCFRRPSTRTSHLETP